MTIKHLAVVLAALWIAVPAGAQAHDSRRLRSIPCCRQHACQEVKYRVGPSVIYQAWVENGWVDIPEDRIIVQDNPVEHGVLCRSTVTGVIYGFVPGVEG